MVSPTDHGGICKTNEIAHPYDLICDYINASFDTSSNFRTQTYWSNIFQESDEKYYYVLNTKYHSIKKKLQIRFNKRHNAIKFLRIQNAIKHVFKKGSTSKNNKTWDDVIHDYSELKSNGIGALKEVRSSNLYDFIKKLNRKLAS